MNDYQQRRFSARMVRTMFNTVSDKRIAVLGFAFKKDTNDTRESAAIHVCRDLLEERAKIAIYDPRVPESQIRDELRLSFADAMGGISEHHQRLIDANVSVHGSLYEATEKCHAVAVLTEWDEFRNFDAGRVLESMFRPAFIFDGRNIIDRKRLSEAGFEVHSIGRASTV
jgi:UDPglucose 6-dehydrogenase